MLTSGSNDLNYLVYINLPEARSGRRHDNLPGAVGQRFNPMPLGHNNSQLTPRSPGVRSSQCHHAQLVFLHQLKQTQVRVDITGYLCRA